ncbi:DUF1365 domain-containing protein [Actinomycetospora straminea]|uniref:DUF1365 domain-containing protein n=1 Tax=Actinomycetospora straminea TaxID=663607 RepID=A0ABP9EU07_9PSEU
MTAWLYEAEVGHRRLERLDDAFTHRLYLWLVDLDDLPRLPTPLRPFARFRSADHLGDPGRSIRENLDAFLAARGIARPARVLMLAHARVLGHVFNPITLYWCRDATGALVAVVAEVHNTYGGRHHYLLDVADDPEAGRARVDKAFYVSPFFPVDGEYRMRVPEPGATLAATVVLRREGATAFVATLRGRRRAATPRAVLAAVVRHPAVTLRVAAAIRHRGVRLWARGVPVVPRTPADSDRGLGRLTG